MPKLAITICFEIGKAYFLALLLPLHCYHSIRILKYIKDLLVHLEGAVIQNTRSYLMMRQGTHCIERDIVLVVVFGLGLSFEKEAHVKMLAQHVGGSRLVRRLWLSQSDF